MILTGQILTKRQQKAWIGRSEGAEVEFPIDGQDDTLTVYTTRPDTLFGVTYMVIAPEHPLLESWLIPQKNGRGKITIVQMAAKKSDLDQQTLLRINRVFLPVAIA